jgi:alanine racemase
VNCDQSDQWVEVDAQAILSNLQEVRSAIEEPVRLIAVVKANAYGHGAAGTASILESQGVDFFAVTYLQEALRLRRIGIKSDIMLLSPLTRKEQVLEAAEQGIILTLASEYDARLAQQVSRDTGLSLSVHLKIETGLGRFGLDSQEAHAVCRLLAESKLVKMQGIYTHMAHAVSARRSQEQYDLFTGVIDYLQVRGYHFPMQHCANSSVLLLYPHMQMNAVRIGTLLTGQYPVGISGELRLKDPFKFKCRIISLKSGRKGEALGYYSTYRLKGNAQIAVIPVGFINGLALEVGNPPAGLVDLLKIVLKIILAYIGFNRFAPTVSIKGESYPVRGKVFMQMALIEIPEGINLAIGDEAEVGVRKTLLAESIPRFFKYRDQFMKEEELDPTRMKSIMGRRMNA